MRPITAMQSQWKLDTRSGESLSFELCKGGYFSDKEEYGLKVTGKTSQESNPSPELPKPILCVKAGTVISCGNSITVPTDLYEDDIWYPSIGKVVRNTKILILKPPETLGSDYTYRGLRGVLLDGRLDATYHRSSGYCSHEDRVGEYYSATGHYMWLGAGNPYIMWVGILDHLGLENWQSFKSWLESNPVTVAYKTVNPNTEYYEPQKLFSHSGSFSVNQNGVELEAELCASMLVRR